MHVINCLSNVDIKLKSDLQACFFFSFNSVLIVTYVHLHTACVYRSVSLKIHKQLLNVTICVGDLTTIPPPWMGHPTSPIETNKLITSIAIEAMEKLSSRNLDSVWVIELSEPIGTRITAIFLVGYTHQCLVVFSNALKGNITPILDRLSIEI